MRRLSYVLIALITQVVAPVEAARTSPPAWNFKSEHDDLRVRPKKFQLANEYRPRTFNLPPIAPSLADVAKRDCRFLDLGRL